jgi:hypothetical protein
MPVGSNVSGERSPSGLWRRTGNAVRGNPSRVRIPPSPPNTADRCARGTGAWTSVSQRRFAAGAAPPLFAKASLLDCAGRARRGTSGALNLQSAPAGLNSHPRTASLQAAASSDVEDRVPRSDEPRTVSGPEGSSTKRSSSGAAERPGPSRSSGRAQGATGRRWVHGIADPRGRAAPDDGRAGPPFRPVTGAT